ncbi:MAG: CRISPR-associated endonuclease Cas2 [candidate division WOR-3 bacterium]
MFIVISYDIKSDRRRNRVLKTLKNYGTRVQFSVFECNLNSEQFERLKNHLSFLIKPSEDSIRFYRLCEDCKRKVFILGLGILTEDEEVYIV